MKNEIRLEPKNIKNQIKSLVFMRGLSLLKLKEKINEKYKKTDGVDNLLKKIRNSTLRVEEFFEILDVLDYDVVLKER